MLEEDNEVYQCSITIKEIKLNVKFPCKLTLNYQNKVIKADVTADSSGKYVIEREVKTKSQNGDPIEVLIHLTTEKGGNIMAGIIKLNPKDLSSSEGQSLTVGLQKCLDQSASCLLKVERVWLTKTSKAKSLMGDVSLKNRKNYGDDLLGSGKKLPPTIVDNYRNVQTRSEFPGFNMKKPSGLRKEFGFEGTNQASKFYGLGPKSYVPEVNIAKSKNIDRSIELRREGKFRFDDDNKTVGKREIDPSYRLTVEANQKNLKMDIMKYKMKAEQQEKTIEDKNKQIKQLKEELSQLHRQSVEKGFYQEEISSKNLMIQKLEDTAKQLNKENNRLESRIIELQRAVQEGKSNLHLSLQKARDEKERREAELGKELSVKKDEITLLNDELRGKNNQIIKIKKIIEDLEKNLQGKTFDYEKSLQGERAEMAKLEKLLNQKIKQLQQINKSSATERQTLTIELKKKSEQVQKLQTHTNHLLAEIKQVSELQKYYATYKTKHSELQKAYEKLEEEKKEVEKHYLKLMETKEKDYGEFKEEQSGLINSYKKKNTQLTEKTKSQQQRIYELENKITLLVAEIQKIKRSFQLAQKDLSSLTESSKQLNLSIKQKDDLLLNKQKELSQLEAKLTAREGLIKKDLEYKTEQLTKLTAKFTQMEHLYRNEKQTNQTLRFQSTKIQGKHKLQQEIISRLNRQIEQTKVSQQKRQLEYKQEMKELNEKIRSSQLSQKKLNKQLTEYEMLDLNRKNQINRLNKELQILKEKLERQLKRTQELQNHLKESQQTNSKLQQSLLTTNHYLKELQNNNKALQADFTKTQKIKTIIVEEKTSVQNQLLNLKKEIQDRTNKQAVLNKEIKELKEQLSKITLKANTVIKDFQTFKENLYTTIQSSFFTATPTPVTNSRGIMNLNLNLNKSFNFGFQYPPTPSHHRYNSYTNIHETYTKGSNTRRLHQSEVLSLNNQNHERNGLSVYEPRFNEIIESYGRESQQTISQLQDTVRKQKSQIQRFERQSSQLSSRLQSTEHQTSSIIQSLQRQVESISIKNQQSTTEWEQKLMLSQRANRQKEQIIQELNEELQAINHQLAANARTHQIQLEELALKIQQLKGKMYDLQAKNDFSSMTILANQEKTFLLQSTLSQLQEQFEFEKQKVERKDKLITQHTSRIDELTKLIEQIKKEKLQLNKELLSTQEKLEAEKDSNNKHKKLLLEEEQKNKEIKGLTNNLIKQKQTIVKNEIIISEKVIELEDLISKLKIEKDQLIVESDVKSNAINGLKAEMKKHLGKMKQLQEQLQKEQHQKLKLIESNKQKEKKIQQKELQIKNLQINLQKLLSKYQQDTKKLNQQHEQSIAKFSKQIEEKQTRILQLSNEIEKLTHLEKKHSEQNISLEEQIFFQKQTNSLANSRFDTMNRDIDDLQSKLSQAIREIDSLNEEIRDREEKLFELSNKLYSQDSKLDMKQLQLRERLQKLDIDWKNKYQETLEDYEAKIESYEREKYYLKQKLQQQQEEISKLQNEKRALMMEEETDKKIYQDKMKKIQTERLSLLVEKNREIQKLRLQIQQKQDKIKELKHEKDIKEDDIFRFEQKLRDKQERLSTQQQTHSLTITQLQKELELQRKKDSQLKKYKQLIKNNLWSSEREIKRVLQLHVKNIMALCEEDKKNNVIDVMKQVEAQVVKAIQFNIEGEL